MRDMLGQAMEREIFEQPDVLARNVDEYLAQARRACWGGDLDLILLAARGSSDHAALYARYLFEVYLQIPVSLSAPSVITRYGSNVRYRRTMAIGISQSGAAPDVAEVIKKLRQDDQVTMGITNTADSPLTRVAENSLLLEAGPEKSVPATKTYTTTLLALYQTARALGAKLPDPSPYLPDQNWLFTVKKQAEQDAPAVLQSNPVFMLARGFSFTTALEAALKLMESALIPAKGYSTADFEHGPRALAGEESMAIGFGSMPQGLEAQGCVTVLAPTPSAEIPEALLPIWHAIYAQFLALSAARLKEIDPDTPQHIRKVTRTH
jgi:glucosamine--fructose-6-phosphate aminotransferase (isomerizing)